MTIIRPDISARAAAAPRSGIGEIVTYARGRENLMPLWIGEGDLPTPDFITRAASEALLAGETFYTWTQGIPALREAIVRYYQRHYGVTLALDNIYVTGSGMQSIVLAIQTVASAGDEIIHLSPAWPNVVNAIGVSEAKPVAVELGFEDGRWVLDMERLKAAITPKTSALFINSPSNPTGWTATREDLKAVLELARQHGLWIIADEIYGLYYFNGARAPSFMDVIEPEDRIIFANSFSKNWCMTGWRVGWMVAPAEIGQTLTNLIQYSTSGVAQFMQKGAIAALDEGDDFVRTNIERARISRDILCDALIATNRVETRKPDGALYAFLKIDGVTDSREEAFRIVDKTGVGMAPGTAFGPGGQGFMRACYLRDPLQIEDAANRLSDYIRSR
ncbi:aspartate/methionine/tyrosine aminotransferase [Neorhizobium sp. R1-B]|uniref:pyridoxal phosphate-dependent aminotransferase n=1 Tax=Neorhizobium TaxID=1525371 RepID=UPI000CF8E44E|nr:MULTISPECIES: pyridoxal phosphate-dependent aminotransferase [Neorhizobium]TCV73649.1 aspartate/methionine/tyrosine aminotransferase [Neorhizobium sp. S3-V5DH]TDX85615.1 aspartate/methionine/tyrosine aminotransferase [Neorhizobium sp. R1-B]